MHACMHNQSQHSQRCWCWCWCQQHELPRMMGSHVHPTMVMDKIIVRKSHTHTHHAHAHAHAHAHTTARNSKHRTEEPIHSFSDVSGSKVTAHVQLPGWLRSDKPYLWRQGHPCTAVTYPTHLHRQCTPAANYPNPCPNHSPTTPCANVQLTVWKVVELPWVASSMAWVTRRATTRVLSQHEPTCTGRASMWTHMCAACHLPHPVQTATHTHGDHTTTRHSPFPSNRMLTHCAPYAGSECRPERE